MHNAPAVSFPVGRSRLRLGLILALVLLGAIVQAVWWWQAQVRDARYLLGWLAWALSSGWLFGYGRHHLTGLLSWDGHGWLWQSGGQAQTVEPRVVLDFQHGLLLSLHGSTGVLGWVWPQRSMQASRWLALRRALFNSPVAVENTLRPGQPVSSGE